MYLIIPNNIGGGFLGFFFFASVWSLCKSSIHSADGYLRYLWLRRRSWQKQSEFETILEANLGKLCERDLEERQDTRSGSC